VITRNRTHLSRDEGASAVECGLLIAAHRRRHPGWLLLGNVVKGRINSGPSRDRTREAVDTAFGIPADSLGTHEAT